MRKKEFYKNCKSLRRRIRNRTGESGQTLTEFVLILAALATVSFYLLSQLTTSAVGNAVVNNLGPIVQHSVEDAYSENK